MITRRIMFLLIHLALCAVEVMVLVVPILPEGNVTIVRVAAEETRDGNSSSMHPRSYIYTVAVVHVDLGFNYIHEGDDATGGLTRLICGTRVFESHDLFESSQDDVTFPRHMVTYEDSHMYLPTSMAKFLFKSSDSTLTTFLVLDAVKTSRMEVLGTPTRHENFQDQAYELDQCILKILHPSQQTVGPPRIIRRTHDSKLVWGQSFLRLRAFSVNDDDDGGEDDDNEGTRAHKLVSDTIHKVKMKRIQRGACAAHPNVSPKFIEMMASAKNPLMSLMQDMLPASPFELMGTLIATAVTSGLAGSDAETISYVLSQQIKKALMSGLTSRLGRSLIDPLSLTIVDTATETITLGIQQQVSSTVTASVAEALTRGVSRDVAEKLPEKLNQIVPGHITRTLLRDATFVLTNSLTHAMVPAIVHTVSHSPLQDYYCYYCYHFSKYCEYCHYAPSQLYYAQYYTEYYSRYYSQYYASYAENSEDVQFNGI